MNQMGFGSRWLKWIKSSLESASISILVNGSPTEELRMSRGVRQGDPIAPFLFLLAAEGLNQACKLAVQNKLVKGVDVGNDKVHIFHLQYADDMVIFGSWDRGNLSNILQLLKCFYFASGLNVNLKKSSVFGLGTSRSEIERLVTDMGCQVGTLPLQYLRLPIGVNMSRK